MLIITLIHGKETLDTLYIKSWKVISQSDKFFQTCPIPHQRLNFQILPKPGFGRMYIYNYTFSSKRVNTQAPNDNTVKLRGCTGEVNSKCWGNWGNCICIKDYGLTWVMFQKGIISATGSVATEQPQPRRATFGGPLGTRRKNSHIDVWESHCKGGTRWSYVHYTLTFTIMFGRLWSSSNKNG